MLTPKTEKNFSRERVRYFLEFSRFLSGFVILVAVALIFMHIISVNISTVVNKHAISHAKK